MVVCPQIAKALAACHYAGMMHQDARPINVMITMNGSMVKLMDFGSADQSHKDGKRYMPDRIR